jgi:large subunit ribosomal protein L13e
MVKHNNIIPNVHLRKHWQMRTKTHFDQPAAKLRRRQRRDAKASAMFPRPVQDLRPIVSSCTRKYAGKVRYGRGFTLDELKAAGLSAAFARTVGIAVDHRRTNTNTDSFQMNTERLSTYKSKLILFPRKDGQPKKGLISDATAEVLKTAAANNQVSGRVLPRTEAKQADEFVAISKEDKDRRVHSILRVARVTAHYQGRRDKRAREAKEAEEAKKK